MALVVGAFVGALCGGASLAGANEIPVECLDYQAAMKRCYGESAERMRMPWQGANRALDMKGLGKQCGAETVRVNEACR